MGGFWIMPAIVGCLLLVENTLAASLKEVGQVQRRHAREDTDQRGTSSFSIEGRKKVHGEGERCPEYMPACKCRSRGIGLDITCEKVTSRDLKAVCQELKKKEHVIKYFKIRHSTIPRLENFVFLGLKIEHLYIHNCHMKALDPSSLSSQGSTLKHLVLSQNQFTMVPTQALAMLRNLDHLNMNHNNLTTIHDNAFEGLSKCTRLSLYDNKIHHIHNNAFAGLTRDLIRLNMGRNDLMSIPHNALSILKNLRFLELSDNNIDELKKGDFYGLDSLDQLTLNHNHLKRLGSEIFAGMPRLTTLYMDGNQLENIHQEAFKGLEANLQSLTMTSNKIEDFPSTSLRPLHRLTTLHIDDNKIRVIREDAFEGYGEHIQFLWLQNNHITDIPAPAFQDLHSLEWIKLYNNELTTLHYELMEPVLDTLMHIDIHSNKLVCDCELRWYRQWIEEEWNEVEEEWLKDTYCKDPVDQVEHNIAEVPLEHMYCDGTEKNKAKVKDDGGASCLRLAEGLLLAVLLVSTNTRL